MRLAGVASRVCTVAAIVVLSAATAFAQRPGGGFGANPIDLLMREDVRKELELVDDQLKQIEKLSDERREQFRQMFSELQGLSREQRMEKMRELFGEVRGRLDKRIEEILLPHQSTRLKQLTRQMQMRGGALRGMVSEWAAAELELSPEQLEALKTRSNELQAELRQKFAQLRADAEAQLMEMLTPEQKSKWNELIGEPFEFERIDMGDRREDAPADSTENDK